MNLVNFGIRKTDSELLKTQKQFLLFQGLGMSGGGIVWGTLLVVYGLYEPAVIPFGYSVITILNFWFFHRTKNFVIVRNIQTSISLLLPFMLQWWLGGFEQSGAVMLWSILALASSATYLDTKSSVLWLSAFIFLSIGSFYFDAQLALNFNHDFPKNITELFLIVNILCNGSIIFGLFIYYVESQKRIAAKLKSTYMQLLNSEKLATLGQISGGIAHEVNTPLGAIKSSAEESLLAFAELFGNLPKVMKDLSSEQKDSFVEHLANISPNKAPLSTREEREKRKTLRMVLEEKGLENARFISDRLVQVGIFEISPSLEKLLKLENFEEIVMITYNLLNQQKNNETIKLAVDKASRVVLALKTYLHTSGGEEMEPTNIKENIETVLTIYHNRLKHGIAIVKNYKDIPKVVAFPDQLNQVWTNLIFNAVQAMDDTGSITIGLEQVENEIHVSIADTGKGIPEKIQSEIFKPFFTTKLSGEGSGIGLDITKRILDDHSAQISFESKEGIGTTFLVKIPIKQKS